jgi:hypothetical protein
VQSESSSKRRNDIGQHAIGWAAGVCTSERGERVVVAGAVARRAKLRQGSVL